MRNKQTDSVMGRILEIDSQLDRINDPELQLDHLLGIFEEDIGAVVGAVYTQTDGDLVLMRFRETSTNGQQESIEHCFFSNTSIPIADKTIAGYVAKNVERLVIPDTGSIEESASYRNDPLFSGMTASGISSCLAFPLLAIEKGMTGVILLLGAGDTNRSPEQADESLVEALAVTVAKIVRSAAVSNGFFSKLVALACMRGGVDTEAHVKRVAAYSVAIYKEWAERQDLRSDNKYESGQQLRLAAMMHDVGNIGINDVILKSPQRLNEKEFRVMQSHTWLGARKFKDDSALGEAIRNVALHHHENWDGSGYPGRIEDLQAADVFLQDNNEWPLGLSGIEIPLFARIVSVADVYDALNSRRAHRDAWNEEDILELIRKEAGRKFDPELVEIFFDILPEINRIRSQYPDS